MTLPPEEETFQIGSGMKVIVVRHRRLPQVHARLVIRTRPTALLPTPELPLIASIQSGGYYSGLSFDSLPRDGYVVREHTVLPKDLQEQIGAMSRWARYNQVDSSSHQRLTELFARVVEQTGDEPYLRLASFESTHLLGHPRPDAKTLAERVRKLPVEQVEEWLRDELRPQNATLILVGDLPDAEQLKGMLEWEFFGWVNNRGVGETLGLVPIPPPSAQAKWPAAPEAPAKARALLYPHKGSLSKLTVTVRGDAMALQSLAAWNALAELLEERLSDEFRERRGIAYGVYAEIEDHRNATLLSVTTSVRPEHVAAVVEQIRAALRESAARPASEEELRAARWEAARHFDDGFVTLRNLGSRLQSVVIRDASPEVWRRYPEQLASLTPQSVGAVARTLKVGGEAITITGNLHKLEEALRAAGIEVETLPPSKH